MVEAKLLRKKLKNGLIVDKWDLVTIIEKQQAEISQQNEEKKALYNLVVEQDKKIIDLAFKLAYAERGNEIVKKIVVEAEKKAIEILTTHRKALDAIAKALVEVETIEREEFEKILITNGITPKKKEIFEVKVV